MKYHRPCKIVYSMAETILVAGKRAKLWTNARLGATKDGHLNSLVYDLDVDCGGYEGLAELLISRYHKCIGGCYNIPKAYGEGRIVLTNNNPYGAVRGPGGVEMAFVSEILIDMMAEKLGADPLEFRYQNAWREGNWRTGEPPPIATRTQECWISFALSIRLLKRRREKNQPLRRNTASGLVPGSGAVRWTMATDRAFGSN